jgi:hypothetical protein
MMTFALGSDSYRNGFAMPALAFAAVLTWADRCVSVCSQATFAFTRAGTWAFAGNYSGLCVIMAFAETEKLSNRCTDSAKEPNLFAISTLRTTRSDPDASPSSGAGPDSCACPSSGTRPGPGTRPGSCACPCPGTCPCPSACTSSGTGARSRAHPAGTHASASTDSALACADSGTRSCPCTYPAGTSTCPSTNTCTDASLARASSGTNSCPCTDPAGPHTRARADTCTDTAVAAADTCPCARTDPARARADARTNAALAYADSYAYTACASTCANPAVARARACAATSTSATFPKQLRAWKNRKRKQRCQLQQSLDSHRSDYSYRAQIRASFCN